MDAVLEDLRRQMARLERSTTATAPPPLAFGIAGIDAHLPGGGLAAGALHEIAGGGPDIEHGTAAALLIGGILARTRGRVLWAVERRDLFFPALDGVGLRPDRVVFAETGKSMSGKSGTILLVMEEGLRHRGLAAVVGELSGRLTLTASRRLQLAAEATGVTAFVLRRSGHTVARIGAAFAAAFAACAGGSGAGAGALAARSGALPRRRGFFMDGGGVRCAGSSLFGCRPGRPTGGGGTWP
jgi:protein ImuA